MRSCRFVCVLLLAAKLFGQSNPPRINQPPADFRFSRTLGVRTRPVDAAVPYKAARTTVFPTLLGAIFEPPVQYGISGFPQSVTAGDLNLDGKVDLVVALYGGGVAVLLGNGDGTFHATSSYVTGGSSVYMLAMADVNGDGKPDLLVANQDGRTHCSQSSAGVLLGNGDGTFQAAVTYCVEINARSLVVSDVNGDGKPDLLIAGCGSAQCKGLIGVLLGNGDGTFGSAVTYDAGGSGIASLVAGDVNGDGKPDVMVANPCSTDSCLVSTVGVLIGNGDGTFQGAVTYGIEGVQAVAIALADLNDDGKPDLVVAHAGAGSNVGSGVGVLLGNGDGTFQAPAFYTTTAAYSAAVADVDGDGKPDLLVATSKNLVDVLLGNGDGTFQAPLSYNDGGDYAFGLAVADFNGDGRPDVAVANIRIAVLINTNRTATTTTLASSLNPSNFGQTVTLTATVTPEGQGSPRGMVTFFDKSTNTSLGNFSLSSSGAVSLQLSSLGPSAHSIVATYGGGINFLSSISPILNQVVLGAAAKFSATSLSFGNQTVATSSPPQSITLKNTGDIPLTFNSITITGTNLTDFTQTNTCGSSLAGGATCTFSVTFTPTAAGTRSAALTLSDNAPSKIQKVQLMGVGVLPAVKFAPTSLTFPTQIVFTTSAGKTVTVTNSGLGILNISKIAATAPFSQTNNCGSTLKPSGSCTLTITFRPSTTGPLTGTVSISDNAPASPQKVSLTGTGTAVQLTPAVVRFGNQPVGTTSLARVITFSNKGHAAIDITSIAIIGTNAVDFTQTNTCGTSVASGASCFIKVKFTPAVAGARSAAVSVSDDGGGSPQKVALTGTGT